MAHNNTIQNSDTTTGKKVKFGLMSKMLLLTIAPLVVILIVTGIILLTQMRGVIHELKKQDINSVWIEDLEICRSHAGLIITDLYEDDKIKYTLKGTK